MNGRNEKADGAAFRIAFVGLRFGGELIGHYRQLALEGVEVVGACDATPAAFERAERERGIAIPRSIRFDNYERMLRETRPDLVFVATPLAFHAPMTIQALEAGVHAYVSKPLCPTLADGEAMIAARDKAGRHVEVGFQLHYAQTFDFLRRRWKPEYVGEVRGSWLHDFAHTLTVMPAPGEPPESARLWQNRMDDLGGYLLDCAVHRFDAHLRLLGKPWRRVWAHGRQFLPGPEGRDTNDENTVLVVLEDGAKINYQYFESNAYCYSQMGFVGSRGKLEMEFWLPDGAGSARYFPERRANDDREIETYVPPPEASKGHLGIAEQMRALPDICRGRAESLSTLESAMETLSLQLGMRASLRRGDWVERKEITDKTWS